MEQGSRPKWQEEVEQILRKRYQGDELSEQIEKAQELANLVVGVEVPSGDNAELVSWILKEASRDLRPLAAVYAGFQLGVAYERQQNADRA
ncbi:hypothetical protein ES703_95613 [subsurface metagenome]